MASMMGSVSTVVMFAAFIGIVVWAYSGRRQAQFDQAANLPFADSDAHAQTVGQGASKESAQ